MDHAHQQAAPPCQLTSPIDLPCGVTLPNRIAKAAMTEGLADAQGIPGEELAALYRLWSDGGAGMLLSGNIQVDRDHLERPGNIVIDGPADARLMAGLSALATAATHNGNHFWAQLNHSGRQTPKAINPFPKAPFATRLRLPGGQFGMPVALTIREIVQLIAKFANAAATVKAAGFTGVQVHAAHGYLLSSFLSPRANQRGDHYGGPLENRARALMEVVAAVRQAIGPQFPLSVKLNSADFLRGGFAFEDSVTVARWLEEAGVDLIEISGGTYEQPKLLGITGLEAVEDQNVAPSTASREAYFVDFAKAMQAKIGVPLMVTGGFRSAAAMAQALAGGGADVIGLGRPMCVMPDAPQRLFDGLERLPTPEADLGLFPKWLGFLKRLQLLKAIDGFAGQYWFYAQIFALARRGAARDDLGTFTALKEIQQAEKRLLAAR